MNNLVFRDPADEEVYRYLSGAGKTPAEGEVPTPACMPKRRPARQGGPSAADIARAEGLDLGPLPAANRRPARSRGGAGRPRKRFEPSPMKTALDLIQRVLPGLSRQQAVRLAKSWARVALTSGEVSQWLPVLGCYNATALPALRRYGITTDMLDTRIDGTVARTRLRNGEGATGIAAALRAVHRQG